MEPGSPRGGGGGHETGSGMTDRAFGYYHGKATTYHRRRIYVEEKAKVVAAVWGTEFNPFLAALAILHHAGR